MPGTTTSATLFGIEARPVTVEVDVHRGLPNITVVGMADVAIQEARERIRSAVKNSDADFPTTKITINLSPAEWRKEGSGFDLPIAIALLLTTKQINNVFDNCLIVGELNLAGQVRPTNGILAVAELARRLGRRLIVPADNAAEASLISGVKVVPVETLSQLIDFAGGQPWPGMNYRPPSQPVAAPALSIWPTIRGQQLAKRAIIIAAAGGHNVLLVGPPGAGKTMLAKGLRELLPPLSEPEALTVTKIHSVAGCLPIDTPMIWNRPYRQPHHTMSVAALVGGGRVPKPGELSLAHHGVLFLDELAEFSRDHIEALRQPLEDGVVTISRVSGTARFPAGGMLIAAMNPCPCGYRFDRQRQCTCPPSHIRRYLRRISGPVLDRFDLFVTVPRVTVSDLKVIDDTDPRAAILGARSAQAERQGPTEMANDRWPSQTSSAVSSLGPAEKKFMDQAMDRWQFSMRAYHRIIRVSRTIADLGQEPLITVAHLAEAVQYRPPLGLLDSLVY